MELISTFEENGKLYATDTEGNVYLLQKIAGPNDSEEKLDTELISKIETMLNELKLPKGYTGSTLLVHCLYFAIKDKKCQERLYVNLYPKVARLNKMAASSVPSYFAQMVLCWKKSPKYQAVFGYRTLSPKELILSLVDYYYAHQKR